MKKWIQRTRKDTLWVKLQVTFSLFHSLLQPDRVWGQEVKQEFSLTRVSYTKLGASVPHDLHPSMHPVAIDTPCENTTQRGTRTIHHTSQEQHGGCHMSLQHTLPFYVFI